MPRRSRGKLLASAGALLAVCAGCQSGPVRTDAAGPYADARPPHRTLFHRAEPATAVASAAPAGSRATLQRPVPLDGGVVTSYWQPVERAESGQVVPASVPPSGSPRALHVDARGALDMTPTTDGVPLPPLRATADASRPVPIASSGPALNETYTGRDGADVPGPPLNPVPRLVPQAAGAPAALLPPSLPHPTPAPLPPHPAGPPVAKEFYKQSLPPYVVEPPDILLINASAAITLPTQPLVGQHLVRPDGSIGLGIYGSLYVSGKTLEQIQDDLAALLLARKVKLRTPDPAKDPYQWAPADKGALTVEDVKRELQVDVLAYNSKWYYVITDGGGYGEQVFRIPATGNETVLDAISQINGLPQVASKKLIWVARATPNSHQPNILPVDWCGIAQRGEAATNYQVFPGDRIYVNSDRWIARDSWLAKRLAPIERLFGVTLLGSSTVNSIKNGGRTGSGSGF